MFQIKNVKLETFEMFQIEKKNFWKRLQFLKFKNIWNVSIQKRFKCFRSQLWRDSSSHRLPSVDRRQEGGHTRRLGARRVLHGPSNGIQLVRIFLCPFFVVSLLSFCLSICLTVFLWSGFSVYLSVRLPIFLFVLYNQTVRLWTVLL